MITDRTLTLTIFLEGGLKLAVMASDDGKVEMAVVGDPEHLAGKIRTHVVTLIALGHLLEVVFPNVCPPEEARRRIEKAKLERAELMRPKDGESE